MRLKMIKNTKPVKQMMPVIATSLCLIGVIAFANAQTNSPQSMKSSATSPVSYQCTQHTLDKVEDAVLTKQERLAKMQDNLQDSIDQYSSCISQVQTSMSGGGQGANGGSQGDGSSSGTGSSQTTSESSTSESESQNANGANSEQQITQTTPSQSGNTPVNRELTAPKDNASIICQLLWDEIQNASGDRKMGFEKQYKDYNCS